MDVIKTRVQRLNFESQQTGASILRNTLLKEGPGAFFKGMTPKLLVVGPKLMFAYTTSQTLIQWFSHQIDQDP
jgi:hypothetical protein